MVLKPFLLISTIYFLQYFATHTAGKTYYPSNVTATFFQALVYCKQQGFEFASVETKQELYQLDELIGNFSDNFMGQDKGFWVSGTSLFNTSGTDFYWLSDGNKLEGDLWNKDQPNFNATDAYCVEYYSEQTVGRALGNYNCTEELQYICEDSAANNTLNSF